MDNHFSSVDLLIILEMRRKYEARIKELEDKLNLINKLKDRRYAKCRICNAEWSYCPHNDNGCCSVCKERYCMQCIFRNTRTCHKCKNFACYKEECSNTIQRGYNNRYTCLDCSESESD